MPFKRSRHLPALSPKRFNLIIGAETVELIYLAEYTNKRPCFHMVLFIHRNEWALFNHSSKYIRIYIVFIHKSIIKWHCFICWRKNYRQLNSIDCWMSEMVWQSDWWRGEGRRGRTIVMWVLNEKQQIKPDENRINVNKWGKKITKINVYLVLIKKGNIVVLKVKQFVKWYLYFFYF